MLVFPKVLAEFGHLLKEGSVVQLKGGSAPERKRSRKSSASRCCRLPAGKQKRKAGGRGFTFGCRRPAQGKRNGLCCCWKFFEGPTPVYFYYTDQKKYLKAPASLWVDNNPVLLKELRYQLGEKRDRH